MSDGADWDAVVVGCVGAVGEGVPAGGEVVAAGLDDVSFRCRLGCGWGWFGGESHVVEVFEDGAWVS